jgi:hypothetical protein
MPAKIPTETACFDSTWKSCGLVGLDGTADEAVAAVNDGLSEKRTIVHRRMSPDEIEVSRLDALAERELGP